MPTEKARIWRIAEAVGVPSREGHPVATIANSAEARNANALLASTIERPAEGFLHIGRDPTYIAVSSRVKAATVDSKEAGR